MGRSRRSILKILRLLRAVRRARVFPAPCWRRRSTRTTTVAVWERCRACHGPGDGGRLRASARGGVHVVAAHAATPTAGTEPLRVVIVGHSWGSALGTLYAARFPDKVCVYVGTGQIGNLQASELSSYNFVLAEAERRRGRAPRPERKRTGARPRGRAFEASARRSAFRYL